jgi:hypothetical protein
MNRYNDRIAEIEKELSQKTLEEVDSERNVSSYDYTGVGYGYNLQPNYPKTREEALNDIKTPELDELFSLAMEAR